MYNFVQIQESLMKTVSFTELREHARDYVDAAERGEMIRITRHGIAIVAVVPISLIERKPSPKIPAWKKPVKALHIPGFNSTRWLQKERKDRF